MEKVGGEGATPTSALSMLILDLVSQMNTMYSTIMISTEVPAHPSYMEVVRGTATGFLLVKSAWIPVGIMVAMAIGN